MADNVRASAQALGEPPRKRSKQSCPAYDEASRAKPIRGPGHSSKAVSRRAANAFPMSEPSVGRVVRVLNTNEVAVVVEVKGSGWRVLRTRRSHENIIRRPAQLESVTDKVATSFPADTVLDQYEQDRAGERRVASGVLGDEETLDDDPADPRPPQLGDAVVVLRDGGWRRGSVTNVALGEDSLDRVLSLEFEDGGRSEELWPPLAERKLLEVSNVRVPDCIARPPADLVGHPCVIDGRTSHIVGYANYRHQTSVVLLVRFDDDGKTNKVEAGKVRAAMLAAQQRLLAPYVRPNASVLVCLRDPGSPQQFDDYQEDNDDEPDQV